jgi:hypothetical protein
LCHTYGDTEASKLAKGGDEDAVPGGFFLKLVRIVTEGQIKKRGIRITLTAMEDILDAREIVATSDDMLIKLAKVVDSADGTIFLGAITGIPQEVL